MFGIACLNSVISWNSSISIMALFPRSSASASGRSSAARISLGAFSFPSYLENCKSYNEDPDPDAIEYAQNLLTTIRRDIIVNKIGSDEISNYILEIRKALEQLYELNEPFELEDHRRKLEDKDGSPY
jgi:hypothetical protein